MLLCTFVTTLAVVLATACTSNPSPGGPAGIVNLGGGLVIGMIGGSVCVER